MEKPYLLFYFAANLWARSNGSAAVLFTMVLWPACTPVYYTWKRGDWIHIYTSFGITLYVYLFFRKAFQQKVRKMQTPNVSLIKEVKVIY